jgi:hypothetical protein
MAELGKSGIPKAHTNLEDGYDYRSIDDVLNVMSPLLAKHKLCLLPKSVDCTAREERGIGGERLSHVSLKVMFDLVSARDGSAHTIEVISEALDHSDKATAKAMSSAYKYALLQGFCVPIGCSDEADAKSIRLAKTLHDPEPPEGWGTWAEAIIDVVNVCISEDALERTRSSHRGMLRSLSRERADLYRLVGEAFRSRREVLLSNLQQQPISKQVAPHLQKNAPENGRGL